MDISKNLSNNTYQTSMEISAPTIELDGNTILNETCLLQGKTGKWTSYNIYTDSISGGMAKFGMNEDSVVGIEAWVAQSGSNCARLNLWEENGTAHCAILHYNSKTKLWKTVATIC